MVSAEKDPITGSVGGVPPWGPGAEHRSLGKGQSPLKLKTFHLLNAQWKCHICLILCILQTRKLSSKRD